MEQSCYICGGECLEVVRTKLRNDVPRRALQCAECGINYLEPKEQDLAEYYRADYRKEYSPTVGDAMQSREIFEMYLPFQESRVEVVKDRLRPDMKVLDVGCSAGHFLHAVKPYIQECVGIEFNEDNVRFINEELGFRAYSEPIEQTPIPEEYFDMISAFHVVEHVEDPIGLLSTLARYLKPDGLLYVEVPNLDDALLSVYKSEAYAGFWYREPHIFNFSPETLTRVMERAGFTGELHTKQRYNFVNHLNWVMTEGPQKSAEVAMGVPSLVTVNGSQSALAEELNLWAREADEKYRQILSKHMVGDSTVFLGHKIR